MRQMIAEFGLASGVVATKVLAIVTFFVGLLLLPKSWRNPALTVVMGAFAVLGLGMGTWNVYLLDSL